MVMMRGGCFVDENGEKPLFKDYVPIVNVIRAKKSSILKINTEVAVNDSQTKSNEKSVEKETPNTNNPQAKKLSSHNKKLNIRGNSLTKDLDINDKNHYKQKIIRHSYRLINKVVNSESQGSACLKKCSTNHIDLKQADSNTNKISVVVKNSGPVYKDKNSGNLFQNIAKHKRCMSKDLLTRSSSFRKEPSDCNNSPHPATKTPRTDDYNLHDLKRNANY